MARRFLSRGRSRRPRLPLRWTANSWANGQTIQPGQTALLTVVATTDYAQSDTLESDGVTLERIRGSLCVLSNNTTVLAHRDITWGFVRLTAGVSVAAGYCDSNTAAGLTDLIKEDLLIAQYRYVTAATSGTAGIDLNVPFDIKARRRLTNQEILWFVSVANNADDGVIVKGMCRALLKGG